MAIGTGNISLTDVTTEIPEASANLQSCVNYAHTYGFDPTYQGSMNSLYNFKGYDHSLTPSVSVSPSSYGPVGSSATTVDITITADCDWTMTTNNATMVTGFSPSFGNGNATVTCTISANAGAARFGRATATSDDDSGIFSSCLISQDSGL